MNCSKSVAPTEVELAPAEAALIAEYRLEAQRLDAQVRGALMLKVRQCGLTGKWDLSPCGTKLIQAQAAPQPK